MLKMQGIIATHLSGQKPVIYACQRGEGRNRSKDYIERIPFVKWGGYTEVAPIQREFQHVFVNGHCYENFHNFRFFLGANAHLGTGSPLESWFPECSINWDYEIQEREPDRLWGEEFLEKTGPYILACFFNHGFYRQFLADMPIADIGKMLRQIENKFPEHKLVLTGAHWDAPFLESIKEVEGRDRVLNFAGKTTDAQFLALLRRASGFVGHAAGNGMMAQHFNVPTVLLWSPSVGEFSKVGFWHNWVKPSRKNTIYEAVSTNGMDWTDIPGILRKMVK